MKRMMATILLMCLFAAGAEASEATILPVAYVDVQADSWLNVRFTPGGTLTGYGLMPLTDVVILAEIEGWALVTTSERIAGEQDPLGWCSTDYLVKYREYIQAK